MIANSITIGGRIRFQVYSRILPILYWSSMKMFSFINRHFYQQKRSLVTNTRNRQRCVVVPTVTKVVKWKKVLELWKSRIWILRVTLNTRSWIPFLKFLTVFESIGGTVLEYLLNLSNPHFSYLSVHFKSDLRIILDFFYQVTLTGP